MDRYLSIKHAWADSSGAPVYQVTFPSSASDDELSSYYRAVESWAAHVGYPVAWVMDLSRVAAVSAHQRASWAKYMERMRAFDERYTTGSALIVPNGFLRGVVTAIFWLYSPPFEKRVFTDRAEGLAWVRELMKDAPARLSIRPSAPSSDER